MVSSRPDKHQLFSIVTVCILALRRLHLAQLVALAKYGLRAASMAVNLFCHNRTDVSVRSALFIIINNYFIHIKTYFNKKINQEITPCLVS